MQKEGLLQNLTLHVHFMKGFNYKVAWVIFVPITFGEISIF